MESVQTSGSAKLFYIPARKVYGRALSCCKIIDVRLPLMQQTRYCRCFSSNMIGDALLSDSPVIFKLSTRLLCKLMCFFMSATLFIIYYGFSRLIPTKLYYLSIHSNPINSIVPIKGNESQ